MLKKICAILIIITFISAELPLSRTRSIAIAGEAGITPQELVTFAIIAGLIFSLVTYRLAKAEKKVEKFFRTEEIKRREEYVDSHPGLDPELKEIILRGNLRVDMTTNQVIASWGEPKEKRLLESVGVIKEEWVYQRKMDQYTSSTYYLIFVNGRLKEW